MARNDLKLPAEVSDIALDNLETVAQNHTSLYQSLTEDLPSARRRFATAERKLKKIRLQKYMEYRAGDSDVTGKKNTEKEAEALVEQNDEVEAAFEAMFEEKEQVDKLEWIDSVFRQRESSLRHLSQLFLGQYWGVSGVERPAGSRGQPRRPEPAKSTDDSSAGVEQKTTRRRWGKGE